MTKLSFLSGPIARATLPSLAIQVGGIAFGVIQSILTARLLGPEGYGAVAFVFSLSLFLATIALIGTEPLAVREVARVKALNDDTALVVLRRSLRMPVLAAWALGTVILLVLIPNLDGLDDGFGSVIWFTLILFPLIAFILQNQGILRGYGRVLVAQAPLQFIRPLFTVAVLVAVWSFDWPLAPSGYLTTVSIGAALALGFSFFALSKLPASTPPTKATTDGLVKMAAPFFIISVLGLLLREVNTLMLAGWANPEETGLFQPIARIAAVMLLGVQAAAMLYAPRVSELWTKGDLATLTKITRMFTWATTLFAVATALFVIALGDFLLGLFGSAFTVNTGALWWVAGAQIINAACGPAGFVLTMTNRARSAIWPQVAGITVNIGLGALLIPTQGAYGAAIAMSFGIVTWNIAMLITVRRTLGIDTSLFSGVFSKSNEAI